MTAIQREELDKRYADYQNGIGKTYTWDETVAIAEQTIAERKALHLSRNSKNKFKK
jgi:hypothetical protein